VKMKVAVIFPAAGASARYAQAGGLRSKLDEDLGGKPILQRTIEVFTKHDDVSQMIVAGPSDSAAFAEFRARHGDRLGLLGARLVPGGATHRWESVKLALACLEDCTHIAVHDAARPCVSLELIDRVFAAAGRFGAAIPALPVPDTIKRIVQTQEPLTDIDPVAAMLGISGEDRAKAREVRATIDRTDLYLVQTPQVFERSILLAAYAQENLVSTDDAGLVERMGVRVVAVEGDARNIKITFPADVELARAVLGLRPPEGRATHKKF